MITTAAASTITISFLSGVFKKAGETFFDNAVRKVGSSVLSSNIFKQISNEKNSKKYIENLVSSVFTFRTITSGDKDVYLDQIYYPLQVSSYKFKNIKIDDHENLENEKRVCLVGVAGQGKTMTLKKMFLEDLNKKQYFPIFISLRNIDFSKEVYLPEIIEKHFNSNGIECTKQEVSDFVKNTSIRMYFDGFDEVPDSDRKNVLILLKECDLQWNSSVVCSTRPDTEFCKFPGYVTYNVEFLEKQDVQNIIDRNIKNTDVKQQLKKILADKDFLYDSIVTPILVDIFVVTSFGLGKDPDNIASYYDALFSSLAYKHDYHKFFRRERKSEMNDVQLEDCFTFFSFVTSMNGRTTLSENHCLEIFKDAIAFISKENHNEFDIMSDIISVTNLLVKDGFNSYSFIHKSIQDYYAARFVSKRSDDVQKEFWNDGKHLYDKNFCYMSKCLSPNNYFNQYVSYIISYSEKLTMHGIVNYFDKSEVLNHLANTIVSFETKDFANPRLKTIEVGFQVTPIDRLQEVYNRVVFDKQFFHPYSFLYKFCIDNNELIKNKLSERSSKKFLSRSTVYFSEISFSNLHIMFSEMEDQVNEYVVILNGYIDNIWNNYNSYKSLGLNQENNARTIINRLINKQ
ncbi:hypothetical protein BWI95_22055 (plasmid) [Kosakonia cowanii JCM 10956 = DSM 18146]|uniref:NACHT domain-containing protein n=1 Tax=Kosakonia cowanii JCM 10956 = DSM 18146 TaxID=1300165 RepID=A0A830ZDB4_9ENTR|nr:hypothetical protein [Kosakonia cowanii]APZ07739.1 hypothetical protein BWI95_22055 [Kosakonia cowanii JCM 10956 = DSM 18146]